MLFYDPLGRGIATLHPNHTWEKMIFDPWRQETWDVNDTVLLAPEDDPEAGHFFRRLPDGAYLPTWYVLRTDNALASARWPDLDPDTGDEIPENSAIRTNERAAAQKTAVHAGTPTITHFDTLGRSFLTVAQNRSVHDGEIDQYPTRSSWISRATSAR